MIIRKCTYEFILLSKINTEKQFSVLQMVKHYQNAHLNYTAITVLPNLADKACEDAHLNQRKLVIWTSNVRSGQVEVSKRNYQHLRMS